MGVNEAKLHNETKSMLEPVDTRYKYIQVSMTSLLQYGYTQTFILLPCA